MSLFFNSIYVLCIAAVVKTKNLHVKESYTEKNADLEQFQDFFNYDDNVYSEKIRSARHVQLVTESVLEHLLKEINNKYSHLKTESQNTIPNMMQRLKMKLKRHINKKRNKKLKKKQSMQNTTSHYEMMTTPAWL